MPSTATVVRLVRRLLGAWRETEGVQGPVRHGGVRRCTRRLWGVSVCGGHSPGVGGGGDAVGSSSVSSGGQAAGICAWGETLDAHVVLRRLTLVA